MKTICLSLAVATLMMGANAYADRGVGDGGGAVAAGEIVCEFADGPDVIGFDVKHPSNFVDYNASVGLIKTPQVGWEYFDTLNLVRRHRNEIEGSKIIYDSEAGEPFSVSVSVRSFEMTPTEKQKLRYIGSYVGTDLFKLFHIAEITYPKRNLKHTGVCSFWM